MGLLPKRLRNNPVSVAAATTSFKGMLAHINKVKSADVEKLSNPNLVSAAMRLSLATFLEEWTESDVGHEKYIENLIDGFDEGEAIKMGDLLEWMAIGTDDQFSNEVNLPKGVKHTQLVGLHAQLLDFLPMKSYNTFTMVQLLEDDPELVEEVFNNYVELTATEHDALQALTNIVKRGSIESVRLLLEASPLHGEKGYGFTKMENYGSMLVDTFELCRRASVAYKDGNYMGAKALLDQLYDEKGIDAALVRTDLSKMSPMILKVKSGDGYIGPEDLVMVSLIPSSLNRKNLVSAEEGKRKATGEAKKGDKFTDLEVKRTFSENAGVVLGDKPSFQFFVNKKVKEINDARGDVTDLSEDEIKDDVKSMIFDIELTGTNKNRGNFDQIKIIGVRMKDEEKDDDDDEDEAESRRLRRNPPDDGKLSNEQIMNIVRKNAYVLKTTGSGGKKKTNLFCDATELMKAIYSKQEVGNELAFIIHAYLKYGGGSDGTPSADFVPKGTVTFATATKMTKDNKTQQAYQMHIEELPGAREATRSVLVRDKVDPLDKLAEEIAPETRRNPGHGQGPFPSETLARSVAKVMAEDGEDVYMWYCGRSGGWMVSKDHPTDIPANEVRKFPASSKPKKNPKGGGKKGVTAVGNTYAIDLIPKSSVRLRGMKDIKKDNKILHKWRDSSEAMKNLWNKYSATGKGGSAESFVAAKGFTTKIYKMRKGQRWNPLKPPYTDEGRKIIKERAKKANKTMKDLAAADFRSFKRKGVLILKPGAQRVGQVGDSFVKYKKGKVRLELMLARHKESGSLVPFRIFVPAALYRHDNDTLIPRSGSGDTKGAKELLSLIEGTFGKVSFVKNMSGGGLNVAPKDKRSGKPRPEGAIDEGVGKLFKTAGMKVQGGKIARPFLFDNGRITYQAGGRQYVMEVSR